MSSRNRATHAKETVLLICMRYGKFYFSDFSRLTVARERTTGDDGWELGTAIAAATMARHGGKV
ncbi:MAG: hypothetical protein L3J24_04045 [Xanthomonadales bacterium]|nr:hypothetical protein [Xanthomonadales bacterium]